MGTPWKNHLATERGGRSGAEEMGRLGWALGSFPVPISDPQEGPAPAPQPAPTQPPPASFLPALGTTSSLVVNFYTYCFALFFFSYKPIGIQTCIKKTPNGF